MLDGDELDFPCAVTNVVRSSLTPMMVVNERGRITEWNPAAERTFGDRAEEMIGRVASNRIANNEQWPQERDQVRSFFTSRAPGEAAFRAKIDWLHHDGRRIPIEATITEVKLDGRSRFLCSLRDLSIEQQSAEELEESRRALELAVEGAKLGTWTFDLATSRTWYSERSKQMYGFEPGCHVNAALLRSVIHPDDWEEVADPYLNGFKQEKVEVEYRVICPDGSTRWIHSLGALNRDRSGVARTVSGIHLDITDRKRAEAELAETRRQLDLAVEGLQIGLWSVDPESGAVWHSDTSRALWGMSADTPIDVPTLKGYIHPEDWEIVRAPYRAGFPEDSVSLEHRIIRPDGEIRWIHALGRAQRDASGAVTMVHGIHLDATGRKAAEAELARSRDALHQSEKLAALGSLLAGVSHELNNPLAAIVGQAEMLEEDARGTAFETRAKKISAAADRCARIVQTFLAMARRRPPARAPIEPAALVEDALQIAEYALRTTGIAVTAECAPNAPPIQGDRDQLHQVLVNLLINAQQALEGTEMIDRRVTVRTSLTAAGRVAIDVIDNGPGIPAEVAGRIFEPFFTTKPQGAGTGVGLSFSHGIVAAHGGTLTLLPSERGAAFRIELPAAAPVAVEILPQAEVPAPAPVLRRTALVVDDEPDIADTIRELLEREGFQVKVASDGAAALMAIDREEFDIVLSDLRMPGVSGPEMYERLSEVRPHLLSRVGFVTGDTLGASMDKFLRDSGRPVLEKPFTRAGVRILVQALIDS